MATIKKYDTIFYVFHYFGTIYRGPWVTSCYENLLSSVACELVYMKRKINAKLHSNKPIFFLNELEFANLLKEYLSPNLNKLVITLQNMKMVGQPLFIFIVHSIIKGRIK